jgi:hypothetical protein
MEALASMLAMGWGGIVALGIVLVLLVVLFVVVLRKAIQSSRQ